MCGIGSSYLSGGLCAYTLHSCRLHYLEYILVGDRHYSTDPGIHTFAWYSAWIKLLGMRDMIWFVLDFTINVQQISYITSKQYHIFAFPASLQGWTLRVALIRLCLLLPLWLQGHHLMQATLLAGTSVVDRFRCDLLCGYVVHLIRSTLDIKECMCKFTTFISYIYIYIHALYIYIY